MIAMTVSLRFMVRFPFAQCGAVGAADEGCARSALRVLHGFGTRVTDDMHTVDPPDARQRATELWLAGNPLLPEAKAAKELDAEYWQ